MPPPRRGRGTRGRTRRPEGRPRGPQGRIETLQTELEDREERIEALESELDSRSDLIRRLRDETERLRNRVDELERDGERPDESADASVSADAEEIENAVADVEAGDSSTDDAIVHGGGEEFEFGYVSVDDPETSSRIVVANDRREFSDYLETAGIAEPVERGASDRGVRRRLRRWFWRYWPVRDRSTSTRFPFGLAAPVAVQSLLSELRSESILDRSDDRRYGLADDVRSKLVLVAGDE